jgi:thiamine-monophosphate kinase
MTSEFSLIQQYFNQVPTQADLGIGDDAALFKVKDGNQLAVSTDMLVAGTHFFEDCEPYYIGWKSLAVNVSDMAAMGAKPKWATLAIALPDVNETWLAEFSRGFFACAEAYSVDLIGGDTTHGSLNISVTIMGEVEACKALVRSGAKADDDIWISGVVGNAALGLQSLLKNIDLTASEQSACLQDLYMPQPRVQLGLALSGLATSCIDISDGLLADLSHILNASKLGADIHLDKVTCLASMKQRLQEAVVAQAILAGGDDYELCFTAQAKNRTTIQAISAQLGLPLTCIGKTNAVPSLNVYYESQPLHLNQFGYDHFA